MQIRLKEVRKAKGFSQNRLAREVKMSLANIQNIESNRAKAVPTETLEKLCIALDCQVGDLFSLVEIENNITQG